MPLSRQVSRLRKLTKGDIMLCIIADSKKGRNVVSLLKDRIKQKYYERASKFSPPLEFRDLGDIGDYRDSLTLEERERHGFCIVSNTGANEEWFEEIVREAVGELEKEGIAGITGAHYRPVIEIFGR